MAPNDGRVNNHILQSPPHAWSCCSDRMSEAEIKKAEDNALVDLQQVSLLGMGESSSALQVMGGGEDKELGKVLKRLLEEQILPRRVS